VDEKRFLPQTLVESDLDNQGPADEIIFTVWTKTIAETIRKAESSCSLKGIGFAMPGPFDYYQRHSSF
jgi:hypothetical protein